MRVLVFVIAALLFPSDSFPSRAAEADNWPQWRGPSGRGVSEATDYPAEWSPEKNIAWKTSIPGRGHSSPVVWATVSFDDVIEGAHVLGTGADHLGYDLKPGYLHPDSVGVDYRYELRVMRSMSAPGARWERTAYEG